MLPMANSSPMDGVYVEEGMLPVPAKLARKINRGVFVAIGELLHDFWASLQEDEEAKKERKVCRSRKVLYVAPMLWTHVHVAVRESQTPTMIPELMAYMSTVIRTSQDYSGLAHRELEEVFGSKLTDGILNEERWGLL